MRPGDDDNDSIFEDALGALLIWLMTIYKRYGKPGADGSTIVIVPHPETNEDVECHMFITSILSPSN